MKQLDFEHGTVTGNILGAAVPMLVAQILNLLYNIVDRIYIARIPDIGTAALGAVGLCFPIIVVITAFSNLFGSGGAPLFAIARGSGDKARAGLILNLACTLLLCCAGVLMVIGLLFAQPIIRLFATDPAVVDLGVRFLRTSALFYMLPAATNGIQGFFRGMGDLKVTLNSSMLNMGGRVAAAALFVLVMKRDIEALPFSYAVGWLLMLLYELPMLVRFLRSSEM